MLLSLTLALALGGIAPAPTGRVWDAGQAPYTRRPEPEFPMRARSNRGRVELICDVVVGGRMQRCQIVSAEPAGQGFERAAEASMRDGRLATGEGSPKPGDRIRAVIGFWNGR